ncbi:MAG TPA: nuclear transport factor 2 family protein [Pseudonocardia sp.]|jgi:ketosteroid isomerase-like protein|nr:nuclear transport factor 2 family protein [Pseudonocardia sp.]
MTEPLVELAPRFYYALAAADIRGALALAHPHLELRIPTAPRGVPSVVTGHEGLAGMISNISRTWSDLEVVVTEVHAYSDDPNRGVAEADVAAVNCDGSRYRNHYIVLVEIADGLIRRWVEYYDPAPMVVAIDALRAQARAGSTS